MLLKDDLFFRKSKFQIFYFMQLISYLVVELKEMGFGLIRNCLSSQIIVQKSQHSPLEGAFCKLRIYISWKSQYIQIIGK
jgi:hypothetical protein